MVSYVFRKEIISGGGFRWGKMRIILVGFGVVGQAFAQLMNVRRKELVEDFGINPRIVAVADRGGSAVDLKGLNVEKLLAAKKEKKTVAGIGASQDSLSLVRELEAEVVVEVTPTNVRTGQPGLSHIEAALSAGKHVITANKGPLALSFPVLMELALHNGVQLLFSGCVGGGTPILDFGKRCLAVDKIVKIQGVLNGTTNFILSKMESEEVEFDEALAEAQRLGYAESDPSLDVDGWDTASKVVIIANWLMGIEATIKDVEVKGISDVTQKDLKSAAESGCKVRLLGVVDGGVRVEPVKLDRSDPLCVTGTFNAVKFTSQFAGDEIIIGKGAGGTETASAILRDLLVIKNQLAV